MKKKTFTSKEELEKEFKSDLISISRSCYLGLMCPLLSFEIDDKTMQKIADEITAEMKNLYDEKELDLLNRYSGVYCGALDIFTVQEHRLANDMIAMRFQLFEKVARENGMRYLDDIENQKEHNKVNEFLESLPY